MQRSKNKFLKLLQLNQSLSKEEIKEELVCNNMPAIISGNVTDNFYKDLKNLLLGFDYEKSEEEEI